MLTIIRAIICCVFSLLSYSAVAENAPPANQDVFKLHVQVFDANTVLLSWRIAPGYFLYHDRISLQPKDATQSVLKSPGLVLPAAETKVNAHGETIPIYRHKLLVPLAVQGLQPGEVLLQINSQGCSDEGYCYPPQTHSLLLRIDQSLKLTHAELITNTSSNPKEDTPLKGSLLTHPFQTHWLISLSLFFVLGLLLAFSPCMLPMLPVLSGIIAGQHQRSTRKAFSMSLFYVLGMAFSYALVGALIATIGQNLQVVMQSPWIIAAYSALFVFLAFALFKSYAFHLPASWHTALTKKSQAHATTGRYLGAALMGVLSTLILSPCVTAPLLGVLGYISRTGDIVLGSAALFCLGLGMGMPLLLLGTSLGRWLPRSGPWMHRINQLFALLLLGVAILLISRLIPSGTFSSTHSINSSNVLVTTKLSVVQRGLAVAKQAGKPVFLDFTADWCESCQHIERLIEHSPEIRAALKHLMHIKANVTRNDSDSRALSQRFAVIAPPTLIFYRGNGEELTEQRLVGDVSKKTLLNALQSLQP